MSRPTPHRGAAENPAGRFERIVLDAAPEFADALPDPEDREPVSHYIRHGDWDRP